MNLKNNLPYRKCVGIMMLNDDDKVFVACRIDTKVEAWQMPQGGVEDGEDIKSAALRELEEEISTNNIQIIAESKGWLQYDLPDDLVTKVWNGKYRGQEQKWFLARFIGSDNEINIATKHPEFSKWKWEDPQKLPEIIVPFKRKLYKQILDEFERYIV